MALEARAAVERALARAARAGARAADAFLVEGDSLEVRVRGDAVEHVKQARERSLGIRAFVTGAAGLRSAVTSTSDLSAQAVDATADDAVALARATAEDACAGLPEGFATEIPELELLDPADTIDVDARIEAARQAERAARATDPRITNSEGSDASSHRTRRVYASSEGFLGEYESASHALFCMPIAASNGTMQSDYWTSAARRLSALADPAEVGREAARRALRRLGARRAPTCEVPVLFEPITARSLLGNLAGCLTGQAVYREASFLAGRLGQTIASERVTVIDDGRIPGGLGSKPFDAEGQPTRRNVLVERGRLSSYLLDTYSGRKLGLPSTGNASRGTGSAPGAAPTNLWLEPGELDLAEMVRRTERGLLVTWLFGHGFNPVTGDFSRGASGLWIEDGELRHPVEEITIAGNLADMLGAVDLVGRDLLWLGSVASPSLRVARMTVAGE
jgi:PmbA protein